MFALWVLQAESGVNRFAQATVLAQIMQHIEETDMLAGLESTATPSWVRAHFRYECYLLSPTVKLDAMSFRSAWMHG